MKLKNKLIFFKLLMFLSAMLLGFSLIDFESDITRIAISLSLTLTMVGSFYEWYSLSKLKNDNL